MRRKVLGLLILLVLSVSSVQPNVWAADGVGMFTKYYEDAQKFYNNGQYASAVTSYRQALRINYLDNSARIGLVNSYLALASYNANDEKNYDKAANNFRNALFYLKMYPTKEQAVENSAGLITSATENLNQCLKVIGFDRTPDSRFNKAIELRASGRLAAAAYEFSQAANSEKYSAEANMIIADLMKILGNEPRSADYYKIALDKDPTNGALRMKYARTLDKIGNYDEALVQYNNALANSKGDMEVLYALERIYLKKLAMAPKDAELNANIGAIKQAQGDFESALSYYGKAEQLNPDNLNTRLNVGTLYQQKKDYLKALKAYDSVLTMYPDNVQANLYKAQALSEMGDKSKSLEYYKKVLSLDPANVVAKNDIINVMQASLSTEDFLAYLSKNASSDRNIQNILYDYAYKLHKENKIPQAILAYKAVINSNPANVDAYVNLAICYASSDDYKNAINILNTAKTKFPANNSVLTTLKEVQQDSVSVVLNDASKYYANKDYKKAIEQYLKIVPATENSLLGIAASYKELNNFDKAIEYYQKAEAIASTNDNIPYYIGYLYSEQQKWGDAENYLQKALKLNPQSQAKELLAYVQQNSTLKTLDDAIKLYEANNYESALTKFNEIIKRDSKNAYAYYYRGVIYDAQKKVSLAISDYLNVLKNTSEIPIANYMLAVDYDSLEKYKEAYNYYSKFVSSYQTEDEYLNYAKSRMEELKAYAG